MRAEPIRTLRLSSVVFVVSLAMLCASGLATAQDEEETLPTVTNEPVVGELSGRDLNPRQKQEFAQVAVQELESATNRILRLIEEAQKKKDVVLLNCLNDKLGALRGLLKVAGDSKLNLAEAAARENLDLQEHNFRKLFIAQQQATTVTAEADACVGQVGIVTAGQTRVVVTVEGGTEGGESGGPASTGGSSRPPDASPFL